MSEFKISHRGLLLCSLTSLGLLVLLGTFARFAFFPETLSLVTFVGGDAMAARVGALSSGFATLLIFPTFYALAGIIVYFAFPKEFIEDIDQHRTVYMLVLFASMINTFLWTFLVAAIPCGLLFSPGNHHNAYYTLGIIFVVTILMILTKQTTKENGIQKGALWISTGALWISTFWMVENQNVFTGLLVFIVVSFVLAAITVFISGLWTMSTRAYASFVSASTLGESDSTSASWAPEAKEQE